jgi:hypothetical protein
MLQWGVTGLPHMITGVPKTPERLLMVYDFASQPFSVGDILIFQEVALVLRDQHKLRTVDMAMVYDPQKPVVHDPAFRHIESENFLFHLSSILPAAQVNPFLGSLLLFDSHRKLELYIADNADGYLVWPSIGQYLGREYLIYHSFNKLFHQYFERYGYLPHLRSRPAASRWASLFLNERAKGAIPVTVQLRRNPANPSRDSNIDAWLAFFSRCVNDYPTKFVVVCAHHEIDARLRSCTNVVVAKDYGTTLELDLALLEHGKFHMGASSGPGTMLMFSGKPYCMFNWGLDPDAIHGIISEGQRHRFEFSTPLQTWTSARETEAMIHTEFDRMWTQADNSSSPAHEVADHRG